jgi:ribosomal protein L11 methyltransferase
MNWHEITVKTTEEATEMVTYYLRELGALGLSIEDSSINFKKMDTSLGQFAEFPLNDLAIGRAVIKAYFENSTSIQSILDELQTSVASLDEFEIDTGNPEYAVSIVDDEDWANVWKQYFKPFAISDRIVVKPVWETYEASEQQLILEIDPGMAFGTGTHATTALCVRALEKVIVGREHVVDIGTGSGILAIAAVKLGAGHVLALDLDPVSVASAAYNASHNQLQDQITVLHSDLLQVITSHQADRSVHLGINLPVQIVVANILAEVIVTFTVDVFRILQPGGLYITSGIIQGKAEMVIASLTAHGFEIIDRQEDSNWVALIARKP